MHLPIGGTGVAKRLEYRPENRSFTLPRSYATPTTRLRNINHGRGRYGQHQKLRSWSVPREKDLDERLAVCHCENDELKARIATLTEDVGKQKARLDAADERALEFAGERDAARAEVENLKKALGEEKIARATAEATLTAYKHTMGNQTTPSKEGRFRQN